MSIEQLLFFLLLVAFPLLARLIRAMRARTGDSPGDRDPALAGGTVSRPPPPVSVPDAGATASERLRTEPPPPVAPLPPPLPQAIRHVAPGQLRASEREPRVRRERKLGPATSLRLGRLERPIALKRVIAGGDLRRAIVLIAVLGPCRALERLRTSQLG